MKLLDWLFGRKPDAPEDVVLPELGMSANGYKQALDAERQRYQDWLHAQVCRHCKAPYGTKYGWLHEDLCLDCADNPSLPYTGSARDSYLAATGNRFT